MLVTAGQKKDVFALGTMITGHGISDSRTVSMTDMQFIAGIIDREMCIRDRHFALFDAMQKQGRIWENEIAINTDSEEGTALLDEAGLQQGLPDDIAQLLLSLEVRQALKQLTAEQQQVIELLFLREQKPKEAARLLGCSVRNVTKHRLKGLDKLRLLLKQNG